ncbi:mCG145606, partial [Mus musculus]
LSQHTVLCSFGSHACVCPSSTANQLPYLWASYLDVVVPCFIIHRVHLVTLWTQEHQGSGLEASIWHSENLHVFFTGLFGNDSLIMHSRLSNSGFSCCKLSNAEATGIAGLCHHTRQEQLRVSIQPAFKTK